jgi:hypothetical protein
MFPDGTQNKWDHCITAILNGPQSAPDLRGIADARISWLSLPIQRAKRFYNRLFSGRVLKEIRITIPVCKFYANRFRLSALSVHPNIQVSWKTAAPDELDHQQHDIGSTRLIQIIPQKTGSTCGLFPTCFARVAEAMSPNNAIGPEIILLWPIWELNADGSLPGLLPAIMYPNATYGEQLSFCLSRWISDSCQMPRKIWVFLPIDSLLHDLTITFEERSSGTHVPPEEENRIWSYPGVNVVLYKSIKTLKEYQEEIKHAVATIEENQPMTERLDQIILKRWMDEATTQAGLLKKVADYKQVIRSLTIRVQNSRMRQDYVIPSERVYATQFLV